MAIEPERGCGFRKAGGLYLVGDLSDAVPVRYLPACIDYPQTRSVQWAEPSRLLAGIPPAEAPAFRGRDKALLMWVGEEHYPTPRSFTAEAERMGVSKRVAAIPDDARRGDAVALAHPAAIPTAPVPDEPDWLLAQHEGCPRRPVSCAEVPFATAVANMMRGAGSKLAFEERMAAAIERAKRGPASLPKFRQLGAADPAKVAGLFCLFRLEGVQLVLPASVARNPDVRRKCEERGVQIVEVPDGDRDHVPPGWKLPSWLATTAAAPALPGMLEGTPGADLEGEASDALQGGPAPGDHRGQGRQRGGAALRQADPLRRGPRADLPALRAGGQSLGAGLHRGLGVLRHAEGIVTRRERLQAKADRRREWADKARGRSDAALAGAHRLADQIPLGQPILVGHHSERHARRDAERIRSGMDRGVAEARLAEHHQGKAAGLEAQLERSIFADDPEAAAQLEARARLAEAEADRWAEINRAWRKGGREAVAAIASARLADTAARIMAECPWLKAPLDTTNLRARARADRARAEEVRRRAARAAQAEAAGGVVIEGDSWVRVTFAERPDRAVLEELKAAGFRWGGGSWIGERAKLPASVSRAQSG